MYLMKRETKKKILTASLCAGAGALAWRCYRETKHFQTTAYEVSTRHLPASFDGFTIVQISDLHSACFGSFQYDLIHAIRREKPDLIAVTGDLQEIHRPYQNALDLLDGIVPLCPVAYVYGNHETRLPDPSGWRRAYLRAGAIDLNERSMVLTRGAQSLQVMGLTDPLCEGMGLPKERYDSSMEARLQDLCAVYPHIPFRILLSHRPEYFDLYAACGVDLVLSGHTHGGQFRSRIFGPAYAPFQGFFPKYGEGVFRRGKTAMIISRGLGTSHLPFRCNDPPELVVVHLRTLPEPPGAGKGPDAGKKPPQKRRGSEGKPDSSR